MSFQLVDRITSFQPGSGARGEFEPPPLEGHVPLGVLVEAIGQLASWVAMKKLDFEFRPVAASAGRVGVNGSLPDEGCFELAVEITGIRHNVLSYRGEASLAGKPLLALDRALGPLLPMERFDDRDRVRAVFTTLRSEGLPVRPLPSPIDYSPAIEMVRSTAGREFTAQLTLPEASAIYADHFPRQPVYPATLLLDAQIQQAATFFRAQGEQPLSVNEVTGVKVRAFSGPAEELSLHGTLLDDDRPGRSIRLETRNRNQRVSTGIVRFRE